MAIKHVVTRGFGFVRTAFIPSAGFGAYSDAYQGRRPAILSGGPRIGWSAASLEGGAELNGEPLNGEPVAESYLGPRPALLSGGPRAEAGAALLPIRYLVTRGFGIPGGRPAIPTAGFGAFAVLTGYSGARPAAVTAAVKAGRPAMITGGIK